MRSRAILAAVIMLFAGGSLHAQSARVELLRPIVGDWQSHIEEREVFSSCRFSPQRTAVICDQAIKSPQKTTHVVNVFSANEKGNFSLYVVDESGEAAEPIPLRLVDGRWIYGSGSPDAKGIRHRTVNEFPEHGKYVWRQETSTDGVHWTKVSGGESKRVEQ